MPRFMSHYPLLLEKWPAAESNSIDVDCANKKDADLLLEAHVTQLDDKIYCPTCSSTARRSKVSRKKRQ